MNPFPLLVINENVKFLSNFCYIYASVTKYAGKNALISCDFELGKPHLQKRSAARPIAVHVIWTLKEIDQRDLGPLGPPI